MLGGLALLAWSALVWVAAYRARPAGWCGAGNLTAGASWLCLMLVAMMAPLLAQPLAHLRQRGFANRRNRHTGLFVAGYAAVWLPCGLALQALGTWLARQAGAANPPADLALALAPAPALEPGLALALTLALALAWHGAPARQRCLNACHRRPVLPAFGPASDRAAFAFGVRHGLWCAGSCWAVMLLPWVAGRFHLVAMAAVALWVLAERYERPGPPDWRWRVPRRLWCQWRFRLASWWRRPLAEVSR